MLQQISINQLTADMILAEDINSPNGSVTLKVGTVMTETWVKRITQWGIKAIKVKSEKEVAGFDDNELEKMRVAPVSFSERLRIEVVQAAENIGE